MDLYRGTLYEAIIKNAGLYPDDLAYVCDGVGVTFRQHLENVNGAMAALRSLGVRKQSRLAIRVTLEYDTQVLMQATVALGAVAILCGEHGTLDCFLGYAPKVDPEYLLTDETGVWTVNGEPFSYAPRRETLSVPDASPYDCTVIIFTSGSTGTPKAVMLREYGILNTMLGEIECNGNRHGDIFICVAPLNHILGFGLMCLLVLCAGTEVSRKKLSTAAAMADIEKYRCNWIVTVPTFLMRLVEDKRRGEYDLSSLKYGHITGGPYTLEQFCLIERELDMTLRSGCGMTENSPSYSGSRITDSFHTRARTMGRPFPNLEMAILDDEGRPLPQGQTGEICVQGVGVMLGYYGDPEATGRVVVDSWLHTGDLGYLDGEGCLRLAGRKKDIIIRSGNNLSPAVIEAELMTLPFIKEVAVVGIPDPERGEMPAAAVVLKPGCSLDYEAMKAAVIKPEIPEKVIVLDKLPLTSSGKPDKRAIREMLK